MVEYDPHFFLARELSEPWRRSEWWKCSNASAAVSNFEMHVQSQSQCRAEVRLDASQLRTPTATA